MIAIEPATMNDCPAAGKLRRRAALWMLPLFLVAAHIPAQTGDPAVDKNQLKAHAVLIAMVEALGGQ